MNQSIVLGIGSGRCGTLSLARVLNQQPDAQSSYEEPPLLPWNRTDGERLLRERFARFRRMGKARILGDVASFYLPYIEDAIAVEPDIRIVCLRRPREEVVASFCEWLDQTLPLPTNHWARQPAPGWHHDPNRTRIYPQYETQNREEGIRRYLDEYYQRVEELRRRYPEHIRLFDTYEALNTEGGLRELLTFVGIAPERQVLAVGTHVNRTPPKSTRPRARRSSGHPMDPRRCAILVPFATHIIPACERALRELERRGYDVRRVGGYAAIDQGRNQIATDALMDGYEETMWIDADVEFHPNDVDRLRSHNLPMVGGIYAQKGKRAIASHIVPGTPKMAFGKEGGLVEILYAGAGFLLIRREVYLAVQQRLDLPMCNERFGSPMIPFFHPMLYECEDGHWYLAEDYAFCERVRQCGFKIMADTTIRLWHIGSYGYGWEDAGIERERFDSFTLNFTRGPEPNRAERGDAKPALADFARQHAWPAEKPAVPAVAQQEQISPGAQEVLSLSISQTTRLVVELGSALGGSTRFLADLAPQAAIIAVDRWQASPEQQADTKLSEALPRLFETFLAECWGYRHQIIPVRADQVEGLRRVAEAGLQPEVVHLNSGTARDRVRADLTLVLDLFPRATVGGGNWDCGGTREAVETVARERGLSVETAGSGWQIVR